MNPLIVFSLWLVSYTSAHQQCCKDGSNMTLDFKCSNGRPILLNCIDTPLLLTRHSFTVDEDGNDTSIYFRVFPYHAQKGNYCLAKIDVDDLDAAAVCTEHSLYIFNSAFALFIAFLYVCVVLSTLAIYMCLPELHTLQGKCIIHFLAMLLVGYCGVMANHLFGYLNKNNYLVLLFGWLIVEYFTSATFTWLNVLTIDLWRTKAFPSTIPSHKEDMIYILYKLWGYGYPVYLVLVGFLELLQQPLEDSIHEVFFDEILGHPSYERDCDQFLVLALIVLCWTIHLERKDSIFEKRSFRWGPYLHVVGLSEILITLVFIMGIFSPTMKAFAIVSDLLNLSHGIAIFLLLVVFRKEVLRGISERKLFFIKWPTKWQTLENEGSNMHNGIA